MMELLRQSSNLLLQGAMDQLHLPIVIRRFSQLDSGCASNGLGLLLERFIQRVVERTQPVSFHISVFVDEIVMDFARVPVLSTVTDRTTGGACPSSSG
jgi:hypothetical protein